MNLKIIRRAALITLSYTIIFLTITGMANAPPRGVPIPFQSNQTVQDVRTDTPAGRGGKIIKVTTLADSGQGSLRSALEESSPRIIVFEVGGTISLKKNLYISHPFITLAGQTAPSPGILLKGAGIIIATNDVLIQHLRIRCGDDTTGPVPGSRDALKIVNPSYNVVVEHVSTSWAIDENMSIWSNLKASGVQNVTISKCIISEGLNNSIHPDGPHSKGFLIGSNTKNLALIGNLFAHNMSRNPLVYGNTSLTAANNLFYNTGTSSYIHFSDGWNQGPSKASILDNIFIDGPNTPANCCAIKVGKDTPETKVFLLRNIYSGKIMCNSIASDVVVSSPPAQILPLGALDRAPTEGGILSNVGARPADRDAVDERILREVRMRSGKIIDSQKQVGGWPSLRETFRPFKIPPNPGGDDDGDGYTNIEETLQKMATEVESSPSHSMSYRGESAYVV